MQAKSAILISSFFLQKSGDFHLILSFAHIITESIKKGIEKYFKPQESKYQRNVKNIGKNRNRFKLKKSAQYFNADFFRLSFY